MSEQPSKGEICGALRQAAPGHPCTEPPGHQPPHDPYGTPWVERKVRGDG